MSDWEHTAHREESSGCFWIAVVWIVTLAGAFALGFGVGGGFR